MKGWLVDLTVGGLAGGLVGAVAAVNFVIYTGIEQGYEANLFEVFQHSLIAGIISVMILLAGPVLGVLTARRLHRKRAKRAAQPEPMIRSQAAVLVAHTERSKRAKCGYWHHHPSRA